MLKKLFKIYHGGKVLFYLLVCYGHKISKYECGTILLYRDNMFQLTTFSQVSFMEIQLKAKATEATDLEFLILTGRELKSVEIEGVWINKDLPRH